MTLAIDASANDAPSAQILTFSLAPKEIKVTAGTKIVWTNHDETALTIIAADKNFSSKAMDMNDRFEYTFASKNDLNYLSTLPSIMIDPTRAQLTDRPSTTQKLAEDHR
jgi:plastocyanin